jgi:hypothetical protein
MDLTSSQVFIALVDCDIGCPVIEVSSFYGTQQSRCLPSPEDGNRSSFWNVVFFHCYLGKIRTMDKVRKPSICVCYTPSSEPYSIYVVTLYIICFYMKTSGFFPECACVFWMILRLNIYYTLKQYLSLWCRRVMFYFRVRTGCLNIIYMITLQRLYTKENYKPKHWGPWRIHVS